MANETLTITDNRTGQTYEVPITHGTVRATDLRKIKASDDDFGIMSYDPAYMNTAGCRSTITYIDGDKGILEYRGYPIEQLAEHSTYLEVAYLLLYGELPSQERLAWWENRIKRHLFLHNSLISVIQAFRYDAHPMGILVSAVAAMSTLYPEAKQIHDPAVREKQIWRIIGQIPTIAAFAYRQRIGRPFNQPDNSLSYTANMLYMMDYMNQRDYQVNPVLAKALDVLFILHADHEQNCSTATMRGVGSSHTDPYCALSAAAAALYGPLHGGANEAVLRMLQQIGKKEHVPGFIEKVKKGEGRLMGFGHRVYKNYDPRAKIIRKVAYDVFEATETNPLLEIAVELEQIALKDEYFIARKLYPNVDFYSGLIYQALRFPIEYFPFLFAIPRASGWLAQWQEMLNDDEQKIMRPRQIYLGPERRDYVPMDQR
ncbi:citrate synthase [Candidatus Viridilinea mediisalina]|uniref:Citrate synthase n=1 Tax=Candidatus Viridilinea mediisalina TaxID=2024553 RepID=A0A2A6RH14_9CHLR|nr:citrate synthase [Candidatus Viridilinea mediisalina]PDW02231.1 citrate (Si)-synthase [Candidatus Viridilinea mediisalina]